MSVTLHERVREAGPPAGGRPATSSSTFYVLDAGNDVFFRALAPAKAVGGRVSLIAEKQARNVFEHPHRAGPLPWHLVATMPDGEPLKIASRGAYTRLARGHLAYTDLHAEFPAHEGTAVFSRPDALRAALMYGMRDRGIRVLAECDDNYLAPAAQAYFLRYQGWGEEHKLIHARSMCAADGVVFSTDALRRMYAKGLAKLVGKQNVPELFVARNCIPRADWPDVPGHSGPLRVGFMGSQSHVWDLAAVGYTTFHAARQFGCETIVIGFNPADPDPGTPDVIDTPDGPYKWRSKRSAHVKAKWANVISRAIPWVKPSDYRRAALPLDIGICPVQNTAFTAGKSDAKMLELTISGAAGVCMNLPLYNTAGWVHEVNCLMANSPEEMAEQTVRLIRDPKMRFELVSAAQEYVASERNEDVLRREWGAALAA